MIRTDFVSNSSSSSFIIDKESWDKYCHDDIDYNTYSLYDILDNHPYTFEIEIGPDPWCNINNIGEFKIISDKEWVRSFMNGGVYSCAIPKTLKNYATKYMELAHKYNNLWDVNRELRERYIKDLVEKVIKPNVENMELVEVSGADDDYRDDEYENEEERCRDICWGVINRGVKLYHANTHH